MSILFPYTQISDPKCVEHDAIFRILHFLTDSNFNSSSDRLTYAAMVLDMNWET